ncbi:MAG: chitobiase/beta-hexosaminidase C-terminal domain-containing protein [Roseburia sp.]|nr:chitobiase/beta-hexosaminidase C-terminal domain-containing protein [Roseburia sp.]MCM1099252.1 chitobiase/beta-hexosaminidase C-terminal domain-containing protein [Ruminococcus flavefaciens]
MKCPHCGEEMDEGALYCRHCGEDIHIVPDFEPELESDLEETLHGIREEIEDMREQEVQKNREPAEKPRRHFLWIILIVLILAVGVGAVGTGVWFYLYYSGEYQVRQAVRYTESGAYDKAVSCYNRALELDADNIELRFALAEVYLQKNNKIEYEYLLREITNHPNTTDEQLDRAYGKLIAIYRDRGDYQTINDVLLDSGDEALIAVYQSYIARKPEFSIPAGYYVGIQPLKLNSFGSGKIYYTTDGTEPDENGTQYITPILLETGDYTVKAVFINDYGIVSEVALGEYHIENEEMPAPELNVESGSYWEPVRIEILDEDTSDIYYTTDGSVPTYLSSPYTEPIPMPLGDSIFKFARIVDGVTGKIAERNFHFEMETDYQPAEAVADILQYYLDTGRIADDYGHITADSEDRYLFYFQYVSNINEEGDFYVISVMYQSIDGSVTRTGTDCAVNVYTRELYRLEKDYLGRYKLTPLAE